MSKPCSRTNATATAGRGRVTRRARAHAATQQRRCAIGQLPGVRPRPCAAGPRAVARRVLDGAHDLVAHGAGSSLAGGRPACPAGVGQVVGATCGCARALLCVPKRIPRAKTPAARTGCHVIGLGWRERPPTTAGRCWMRGRYRNCRGRSARSHTAPRSKVAHRVARTDQRRGEASWRRSWTTSPPWPRAAVTRR